MAAKGIKAWFNLHEWVDWVGSWAFSRALFLWALYIGLFGVLSHQIPNLLTFAFNWLVGTSPVWMPVGLLLMGWYSWVSYIENLALSKRDPVLLEMKVPHEVLKTPRAMELVLANLNNTGGETTFIHRMWRGGLRPYFSFELVSLGGEVHMYIQTPSFFREQIEAFMYAEYPDIELHQVEDYASKFQYNPEKHSCFCTNYKLANDVFPIKTYIEYELNAEPNSSYKVDPLGDVLGFLAALKPNEQIWLQILFQGHGATGIITRTASNWRDRVAKKAIEIRNFSLRKDPTDPKSKESGDVSLPYFTWKQESQMSALERHAAKPVFDVGFRGMYIADVTKGAFRPPVLMRLRQIYFPFNSDHLNSILPTGGSNGFDYPWQDWKGMRNILMCRRYFDMMRRRSYFHRPWQTPSFVLTTESLATLFHPPGRIATVPGFDRIQTKRALPPNNLPTA